MVSRLVKSIYPFLHLEAVTRDAEGHSVCNFGGRGVMRFAHPMPQLISGPGVTGYNFLLFRIFVQMKSMKRVAMIVVERQSSRLWRTKR